MGVYSVCTHLSQGHATSWVQHSLGPLGSSIVFEVAQVVLVVVVVVVVELVPSPEALVWLQGFAPELPATFVKHLLP